MAQCSGCGKEITFAKSDVTDRTIPLEKVRAYEIDWDDEVGRYIAIKKESDIFISHFLTCPKANQFSRGGQR